MTWKFYVLATPQRRLFSRILQVLDSQMANIHSFAGKMEQEDASIRFSISSEEDKAHRIEALLYRLEGIQSVSVSNP